MRWLIATPVVLVALMAAGCGGRDSGITYAPSGQSKRVHWQHLNDDTYIATYKMNDGRKLTCVEDLIESSIAMSCNWEVFNTP